MQSNRPKSFPETLSSKEINQHFEDFVEEHKKKVQDYTYALKISDGTRRFEAWAYGPQKKLHLTEEFYNFMVDLDE